jgi:REP element-mobilizing transposase RayT
MRIRNRGYLPHVESEGATYFLTFRLADSLPSTVLNSIIFERNEILAEAKRQRRKLSPYESKRLIKVHSKKIEEYLDSGRGSCWLRSSSVADMVVQSLKHFNKTRYVLHAWCVMPNHVHVVVQPKIHTDRPSLTSLMHSWKSFTSHKANEILNRRGSFWQEEYYDHLIRNDKEFVYYVAYTLKNPVLAGLCKDWRDWPYSGCSSRVSDTLSID